METLLLEVRDSATLIPVIATQTTAANEEQKYLLARASYTPETVIVTRLDVCGAQYDCFRWDNRTMQNAHWYIENHFEELEDGDVIDVQFILGETTVKKISERFR
jgi:hypothetical protein